MLSRYPLLSLMAECDGTENLTALQTVMGAAELTCEKEHTPKKSDADGIGKEKPSSSIPLTAERKPVETVQLAAAQNITADTVKTATVLAAEAVAPTETLELSPGGNVADDVKTSENPDRNWQLVESEAGKQYGKDALRVASSERLRMKTYRVQKDLQELIARHSNRHMRLQNIKNRQNAMSGANSRSRTQRRQQEPSAAHGARELSAQRTNGPRLPDLRKCFEESRAMYLMEAERKKKTLPPLYSSHIPRHNEMLIKAKERNIMKDTASFGQRFFDYASYQDSH